MNKLIKRFLNFICAFLTACLNQGQKLMCLKETYQVFKYDKRPFSKEERKDYKKYINHLKTFGLWAPKRDFRVFYPYFKNKGNNPALIIPAYISNNLVTPVLNPILYSGYFEDKNMFDKIFPENFLPKTFFRRINKKWYSKNYQLVSINDVLSSLKNFDNKKGFVVKPTKNTSSGKGVKIFHINGTNLGNEDFNESLIEETWGNDDLIIQEIITQDKFFRNFCSTALNTIRMVIYNSPVNGEISLLWAGLKIAAEGSTVDNLNAGSLVFGINSNGKLANYGADAHGNKSNIHNGIDFSKNLFIIPNFQKIVSFAKKATKYLFPQRFIAFDITVDEMGEIKIIEFNLRAYGGWYCQFAGSPMYGAKTDEILEYVTSHSNLGKKVFYSIT